MVEHFFWNMQDGVVIEMGALDGIDQSVSLILEEKFGWQRILIDGSPIYRQALQQRTTSFSANVAVCDHPQTVHYSINKKIPTTSGIMEFMTTPMMQYYHSQVYQAAIRNADDSMDLTQVKWQQMPNVIEVPCVSMHTILSAAKVTHVDIFILDVEGAEPAILKSLLQDLNKYHFSVICIEAQTNIVTIKELFAATPYEFVIERGRNAFFKHKDFVPSKRPGLDVLCYRGSVASKVKPREHAKHCKKNTEKMH